MTSETRSKPAGRQAPSPDGMNASLEAVLQQSVEALEACAAMPRLAQEQRSTVRSLVAAAQRLEPYLGRPGGCLVLTADPGPGAMPQLTRVVMLEAERAGLFDAFRDRCETLSGRIADSDMRAAALEELWAALRVLSRAVGAPLPIV